MHEFPKSVEVRGHALEQEVKFAREGPTLADQRHLADDRIELLKISSSLARELYGRESSHGVSQQSGIKKRPIPPDESGTLQMLHAAKT